MKINILNESKLQTALSFVQKRTTRNNISIEDIKESVSYIEDTLQVLLPKKYWKECSVLVDVHAININKSSTPQSTKFVVERGTSGWFIVDISRGYRDTHCYRGIAEHALKHAEQCVLHTLMQNAESTIVRPSPKGLRYE